MRIDDLNGFACDQAIEYANFSGFSVLRRDSCGRGNRRLGVRARACRQWSESSHLRGERSRRRRSNGRRNGPPGRDGRFRTTICFDELLAAALARLSEELPADSEYWQCGSLWVAADAEEFAEVERKFRFYSARGVSVEVLDSLQLAEAEPHLRPGLVGALLMASDSVCYPPCAARYFVERATGYGANLFLNSSATEVSDSGVKTQQGQELVAGSVILATGAETCKLVPAVDVRPRKGHLLITDRYPGFLRHQLIELGYLKSAHSSTSDSVAFNAQPRVTGQILIGSSRQFGVEEGTAEQRMIARMLARAQQYMPALKDLFAIRAWTGFRAATPDKLPLIGLCPGYQRIYLATGHEGLGISSSLGTARLIADEILGRESRSPELFTIRRGALLYMLEEVSIQVNGKQLRMPSHMSVAAVNRSGRRVELPKVCDRRGKSADLRHGNLLRVSRNGKRTPTMPDLSNRGRR